MSDTLTLPPLYRAADQSAERAQRRFLNLTRGRLWLLLGAAFFGLFDWTHGGAPVDWAGVGAACFFTFALAIEAYLNRAKPERTWYEARAAAESVKTLSWRFAVRGEPFDALSAVAGEEEKLFLARLRSIFDVIKDLDLVPPTSVEEQISAEMVRVRAAALDERKRVYRVGRVEDQQSWYQRRASESARLGEKWTNAMLVVELVGVTCGVLRATGNLQLDVLGFASVVVAAMIAWVQTNQYSTLAAAYSVTALELASVSALIDFQATDQDWAAFVEDAEEAFSREHTLWKASRGIRGAHAI